MVLYHGKVLLEYAYKNCCHWDSLSTGMVLFQLGCYVAILSNGCMHCGIFGDSENCTAVAILHTVTRTRVDYDQCQLSNPNDSIYKKYWHVG